jgi:xanthine dehydrogenase accessory factor
MDDLNIYEEMVRLARAGVPSALATVVESAGSSPRKAGAKMLVKRDGAILGTVGGGRVELETIEAALAAIDEGRPRTVPFTLTEENGHVCGGSLLVYIEPSAPSPRLLVIGAGHVGKALTSAAKFAGFRVTVADERPEFANSNQLPDADEILVVPSAEAPLRVPVDPATFIVITTTGFEQDFVAVRSALATHARYIGCIGSARKRETLVKTLVAEGYSPEQIGRVTIPVGLPIGAETPAEIAVSIVAQLIRARRDHATTRCGDHPGSRAVAADGELQAAPAAG